MSEIELKKHKEKEEREKEIISKIVDLLRNINVHEAKNILHRARFEAEKRSAVQ